MSKWTIIIIALSIGLAQTGCMGTFQTARVVPFRVGGYCFGLTGVDDEGPSFLPGVILDGGWPAGPGRFGIGLNLKLMGELGDGDTGFMAVWGAKLQLPENRIVDVALGVDFWAYYPGELKLILSRRLGILEPYACIGAANFIGDDDDGNDFFGGGILTFTGGTMIRLGADSGWLMAVEAEGGSAWESVGFGIALLKDI